MGHVGRFGGRGSYQRTLCREPPCFNESTEPVSFTNNKKFAEEIDCNIMTIVTL